MLGHEYISDDDEEIALSDAFEGGFEEMACVCLTEVRLAAGTTEGDEVEVSGVVETDETLGHWFEDYGLEKAESVVELTSLPGLKSETWGTQCCGGPGGDW